MSTTTKLFTGASKYAGYIESWRGGRASIKVYRGDKNSSTEGVGAKNGFLVNQYSLTYQRTVQNQYFLNVEDAVAILGRGQGQVQLTGLVGSAEALKKLLSTTGNENDAVEDLCNPLIIEITGTTQMNSCADTQGLTSKPVTFICRNAIIQQFSIQGQLQAEGAEMQVANIAAQFTALEMKEEASSSNNKDSWNVDAMGREIKPSPADMP